MSLRKVIGFRIEDKKVAMAELLEGNTQMHFEMKIGSLWEEDLFRIVPNRCSIPRK